MVKIANYIPEWTDKDIEIIQDYEDKKRKGLIKEFVIIPKSV